VVIIPAAIAVFGCLGMKFPRTERTEMGPRVRHSGSCASDVPDLVASMFHRRVRAGAWSMGGYGLTRTVGFQGIWLLIYVAD
jgi:hypothetical protein